jgi:hypothetical protein
MRLSIDAKVVSITAMTSAAVFVVALFNNIAADSNIGDGLKRAYGYGLPAHRSSSTQVPPPMVAVENLQPQPLTITNRTGEIVTWVNNSNMPHRYWF